MGASTSTSVSESWGLGPEGRAFSSIWSNAPIFLIVNLSFTTCWNHSLLGAKEEHVLATLGREVDVPEAVWIPGGQLLHLHERIFVVDGAELLDDGVELQAVPEPEHAQSLCGAKCYLRASSSGQT